MKSNYASAWNRVVLVLSGILSIITVGYYLSGLRAADVTPSRAIFAASKAVANRIQSESTYSPAAVSDVVTKALAFKALLTPAQQATLEQTYTTTLARRWSNLPCSNTCRNGIGLGTLTAEQLAAALEVIRAVAGTTANDGSTNSSRSGRQMTSWPQLKVAEGRAAAVTGQDFITWLS